MSIFELEKDRIVQLPETSFSAERVKERQDLQRILRSRIEVLDLDLLIIAEEYGDWEASRRRIDLLALDRDAKLVVIELKRTDDGGHMELQALRYAAMVSTMTFTQAVEAYRGVLTREGKDADPEQGILDFLAWDDVDEERFASDVRLLLVAQDFSRELTTAVMWLSERDLDIRCIRIRPYRLGDRLLLDVQQIIPLPEAADYQVRIREKVIAQRHRVQGEWTGYFYVNVDEGDWRSWEDFRRYGFVSAGGGPRWISSLRKLQPGGDLLLEIGGQVVRPVVVTQPQPAGGAVADPAEAFADTLADGLQGLEAVAALGRMQTDALGRAVIDGHEHAGRPLAHGHRGRHVGAPHHVRRLGGDRAVVHRRAMRLAHAVRGLEVVRTH